MPTKTKSKVKTSKAKTKTLSQWYEDIDWVEWWEEFSTETNENGTLKYQTVHQFCKSKTKKHTPERRLLWWVIGPLGVSDKFKEYDQFDWLEKRDKGYWYNTPNSGNLAKDLAQKQNALEKMQEVGSVNISFINRLETLCKEVDREYSGRLFLKTLTVKENALRSATYLKLLDQIQKMMEQAQIMYGRCQGIDLQRMDQFFAMFGKGMGQAMGIAGLGLPEEQTRASKAMTMILDMTINKAADRELELPDKDMVDIIREVNKPQLVKVK